MNGHASFRAWTLGTVAHAPIIAGIVEGIALRAEAGRRVLRELAVAPALIASLTMEQLMEVADVAEAIANGAVEVPAGHDVATLLGLTGT